MNKELKDYLLYYLGCECKMIKPSYHAVHELHLSSDRHFILTGKLSDYFSSSTTKAEIKPILRPLSDMTEDEKTQFGLNIFQLNNLDNPNEVRWELDQFRQILSKGFDLFGLIAAGLAIDKTKQ